jgi:hypothetical protein
VAAQPQPPTPTSVNWLVTDGDGDRSVRDSAVLYPEHVLSQRQMDLSDDFNSTHSAASCGRSPACKQSEHGSRIQTVGLEENIAVQVPRGHREKTKQTNSRIHLFATLCMGTISGFIANTANSRNVVTVFKAQNGIKASKYKIIQQHMPVIRETSSRLRKEQA